MLRLHDVSLRFGDRQILDKCSLRLEKGQRLALMGPSGCGKTTLARIALSLLVPDSGTVETSYTRVSAVFQEPRLLPWLTAVENVNLVLSDSTETLPQARAWLERLELGDAATLYPAELPAGCNSGCPLRGLWPFGLRCSLWTKPSRAWMRNSKIVSCL